MSNQEVKVLLTGDNSGATAALEQLSKTVKTTFDEMGNEIESIKTVLSSVWELVGNPVTAIAGFAGVGLAIKEVVEFVDHAIESTNKLSETYEGLAITAGMTVDEFNKITAAAMLVGGSAEDVTTLVSGMERGIKRNSDALILNGIAADKTALSHMSLEEYISKVVETMNSLASASEKDQLLMAAFGRGGMQFADLLVEMNEHMAKANELTKDGGILTEEITAKMKKHREELGEYNLVLKEYQAQVASQAVTWTDLWHNFQAFAMQTDLNQSKVQEFVSKGLVQYKLLADGVNADNKAMLASTNALIEAWKAGTEQSKDYMDAGVKSGFGALPTKHYKDPKDNKDPKESELARLQAALEKKKFLYEQDALAHGQYLQFTKAQEAAFWSENLNDTSLNDKDKERVNKLYFEAHRAVMLEDHKAELTDMESRMSAFKNDALQRLAIAKDLEDKAASPEEKQKFKKLKAQIQSEIKQDQEKADLTEIATKAKHQASLVDMDQAYLTRQHDLGLISDQTYLNGLVQFEEKKYQAELKGLQDRLKLMALEGDKRKEESAKINAEIQALNDKHQKATNGLGNQQADLDRQKDGWAGWAEGIRESMNTAQNSFAFFKQQAIQMMNAVENSMATGIQGMLTGQMSFSQGLKSIWNGIVGAGAQMVSQMIAHWAMLQIQQAIFGAAAVTESVDTSVAQTDASLTAGAAEAWEAYGGIPFVGAELAVAQIAAMEASVAAVALTGAAEGGWFDRPTLTIIGEGRRPELVVPDVAFKDFASNLSANILAQERQAQDYTRQSAGYANAAVAQPGRGAQPGQAGAVTELHVHMDGATILDSSQRGMRNFGGMVIDGARAAARERSVVLVPGQVFGGL